MLEAVINENCSLNSLKFALSTFAIFYKRISLRKDM